MVVKLLTEHHFEFLSLKAGCRGSSKCYIVGNLIHWLISLPHAAVGRSVICDCGFTLS